MESFRQFLQNFPHYRPSYFDEVSPSLHIKQVRAGDYFLQMGQVCHEVGFIKSGLFRHFYLKEEKEITTCFCLESSLVTSYKSLITQQDSEIAIQAVENSEMIVLPYQALLDLYEKNLFWQQLGRMASEQEYLEKDRYHHFITDLPATERYLKVLENKRDLYQRIPLTYLASYLQVSPETLSRIRKKISRT